MPHEVFISYSHIDNAFADAACHKLEEKGIRCWIAPRDVVPGDDWADSIADAIENSLIMLLFFSTAAMQSQQVKRELELAADDNKFIVTVKIDAVDPSKSFKYYLKGKHWLDAMSPPFEQHLERVSIAVQTFLERQNTQPKHQSPPESKYETQIDPKSLDILTSNLQIDPLEDDVDSAVSTHGGQDALLSDTGSKSKGLIRTNEASHAAYANISTNSLIDPSEGDVVTGVIVHKDRDGALLVDIGAKSEGLVRPNEVSRTGLDEDEPQLGDTVEVVVIGRDKEDGKLLLSKKRADFEKAWDKVEEALQDQRVIHALVTERVKGGLVVDLGIRGFVPVSHVGTGDFKHTNLDKYVGQSIALKVIEVDRDRKKVVLSNKDATREERAKQRTETLASIKEGEVREGVVRRVTDYGAYVDLGGIDGLLHVSEMSWARINHPSDVVKVGDKIQVMVLKMRLDQDRISLGLRQTLPDPWTEVPGKYTLGEKLHVTVSRVVPFGAFVSLSEGIEAIIPNSELSTQRVSRPTDVVNPGDEVDAVIIEIKPEERKMTMSLKRV